MIILIDQFGIFGIKWWEIMFDASLSSLLVSLPVLQYNSFIYTGILLLLGDHLLHYLLFLTLLVADFCSHLQPNPRMVRALSFMTKQPNIDVYLLWINAFCHTDLLQQGEVQTFYQVSMLHVTSQVLGLLDQLLTFLGVVVSPLISIPQCMSFLNLNKLYLN